MKQMVRFSCKAQRDGRPCGYTLTIEAGLEDWGKDVMLRHYKKKHPEEIGRVITKEEHGKTEDQTTTEETHGAKAADAGGQAKAP